MKYLPLALIVILVAVLGMAPVQSTIQTLGQDSQKIAMPAMLSDMGEKLVELGVIDPNKMTVVLQNRGEKMVMTKENAGYLLNLLWAVGLANKNPILEDKTKMMNPAYGGTENFASTGGWTLAKGNAMDHYGMHMVIPLTDEQQSLVDRASRNIYRPCCGNSAHFPDCNHGMAMLGLLEMMASEGASEQDMYDTARAVNDYWFPPTPTGGGCSA